MGYSRSEMLLREVYIFERIETLFETDEKLSLMKCIVILRPTKDNIQLLCEELNRPHYRSYYLCKFRWCLKSHHPGCPLI